MSAAVPTVLDAARKSLLVAAVTAVAACQSAGLYTPPPRSLVNSAGTRLHPDEERMAEVDVWVNSMSVTIDQDPTFIIVGRALPEPAYPWETLEVSSYDSVTISYQPTPEEIVTPYLIYAFLHLADRRGELTDWFTEAERLRDEWEVERFIVNRIADAWLLGRSSYDTPPYAPLDELIFAQDAGMLDAMLLYLREDEFPDAAQRFLAVNPSGLDEFEGWFRTTFGYDPPERASPSGR